MLWFVNPSWWMPMLSFFLFFFSSFSSFSFFMFMFSFLSSFLFSSFFSSFSSFFLYGLFFSSFSSISFFLFSLFFLLFLSVSYFFSLFFLFVFFFLLLFFLPSFPFVVCLSVMKQFIFLSFWCHELIISFRILPLDGNIEQKYLSAEDQWRAEGRQERARAPRLRHGVTQVWASKVNLLFNIRATSCKERAV